jgi:hypothetical protein
VIGASKFGPDETTPSEAIKLCKEMEGFGFSHLIFIIPDIYTIKPIEIIGDEIIPALSKF